MDLTVRNSGRIGLRTLLTSFLIVVIAGCTIFLIHWFVSGAASGAPTYDWQCTECGHSFRKTIRDASEDVPIMECRKCGAMAAERSMHFQCRMCWEKFDLPGSQAIRFNLACTFCGSTVVRNLDRPIPGDDQPVEGGLPNPDK